MQTITVNLNLSRGSCRINQPLYLGETVTLSFSESGDYSLILTEPFADSPKDGIAVWAQSIEGKLALTRKALHNAFKKADALQPNMTISAKVFVQDKSGATVADGEVAIEYSPKAFVIDDEDYPLAREVLAQAEAAKNSAVSAKTAAEEAKLKAEGAQSAAGKARDKAQSARNEAQEAKTAAEKALSAAKESAATSSAAKEGAITALNASEAARTAAQNAQEAAEEARDDAETIASDTATKLVEASEKRLQDQILNKVDKEPFDALAQKVDTVVGGDTGKSARTIAAEEVAKVVANAPADLDTLKEIADYIKSDKTGAAQMVTQIDANAKAISAEAARAKDSEAALDERVTELEENGGGSSVEVVTPSADGAGKAADAKAVYEKLEGKQNKLTAGAHINIAEDGTISTLGYKLVELPAGETQLQDRANIHITEYNVIRTWAASSSHVDDGPYDVDWVHKEVHDIGDGSGELEWYVARFGLVPGFYYPIVPVKDVKADSRYYIDYDSQPIPDDPSYGEYKGIVSEVSFIPRRISSGSADYRTDLYIDFRTKRPDTGEDITWKIDAYDTTGSVSSEGTRFYNDYVYVSFGDNYTPPEWNEEDNLYWRFEVSGLSDLPKPGETLKISLELYNHNDYYNALATYEGEITLPVDLDWRFYSVSDFTLEGDATIRYSTPDGGTKEVVDQAAYISINDSYNYGFVDFNFNTSAQVLPGVTMIYYQWKTVAESEEIQIPTIGEELVFSPSQATDESSGYSEYFDTRLLMTEHFTFTPPAPSFEGRARDFLLCVDLTKDRQIELQDVTEVEGGLFALNAGRTLISVTEPIEGKLYASARPLPTENA